MNEYEIALHDALICADMSFFENNAADVVTALLMADAAEYMLND